MSMMMTKTHRGLGNKAGGLDYCDLANDGEYIPDERSKYLKAD